MNKRALAVAAFAASMVSGGAMAQAYVVGGIGTSNADIDCAGTTSCDNSDTAFKIVGGYSFANGFAAELGYMDFGTATASAFGANAEFKASGFTIGGAYQAAFTPQWGANFRFGIADTKTKISGSIPGLGSASDSENTTQPYFGIGATYALTKNTRLGLSADFSRGEYQGEQADLRAITFNVRFDF